MHNSAFWTPLMVSKTCVNENVCTCPCPQTLHCIPHMTHVARLKPPSSISHPLRSIAVLIRNRWCGSVKWSRDEDAKWGAGTVCVSVCVSTDAYAMLKDTFIWPDLLWWSQALLSIYDPCGLYACCRWHAATRINKDPKVIAIQPLANIIKPQEWYMSVSPVLVDSSHKATCSPCSWKVSWILMFFPFHVEQIRFDFHMYDMHPQS